MADVDKNVNKPSGKKPRWVILDTESGESKQCSSLAECHAFAKGIVTGVTCNMLRLASTRGDPIMDGRFELRRLDGKASKSKTVNQPIPSKKLRKLRFKRKNRPPSFTLAKSAAPVGAPVVAGQSQQVVKDAQGLGNAKIVVVPHDQAKQSKDSKPVATQTDKLLENDEAAPPSTGAPPTYEEAMKREMQTPSAPPAEDVSPDPSVVSTVGPTPPKASIVDLSETTQFATPEQDPDLTVRGRTWTPGTPGDWMTGRTASAEEVRELMAELDSAERAKDTLETQELTNRVSASAIDPTKPQDSLRAVVKAKDKNDLRDGETTTGKNTDLPQSDTGIVTGDSSSFGTTVEAAESQIQEGERRQMELEDLEGQLKRPELEVERGERRQMQMEDTDAGTAAEGSTGAAEEAKTTPPTVDYEQVARAFVDKSAIPEDVKTFYDENPKLQEDFQRRLKQEGVTDLTTTDGPRKAKFALLRSLTSSARTRGEEAKAEAARASLAKVGTNALQGKGKSMEPPSEAETDSLRQYIEARRDLIEAELEGVQKALGEKAEDGVDMEGTHMEEELYNGEAQVTDQTGSGLLDSAMKTYPENSPYVTSSEGIQEEYAALTYNRKRHLQNGFKAENPRKQSRADNFKNFRRPVPSKEKNRMMPGGAPKVPYSHAPTVLSGNRPGAPLEQRPYYRTDLAANAPKFGYSQNVVGQLAQTAVPARGAPLSQRQGNFFIEQRNDGRFYDTRTGETLSDWQVFSRTGFQPTTRLPNMASTNMQTEQTGSGHCHCGGGQCGTGYHGGRGDHKALRDMVEDEMQSLLRRNFSSQMGHQYRGRGVPGRRPMHKGIRNGPRDLSVYTGMPAKEAARMLNESGWGIRIEKPEVMYTSDYRSNRMRLKVDDAGNVTQVIQG